MAIKAFSEAVQRLRELGVLRSRQITGDTGEWMVQTLYQASHARSRTNKGWDLLTSDRSQLQVKTQSDDPQNRWNYLDTSPDQFDRLIVLILGENWLPVELYDVPFGELARVVRITQTGKTAGKESYHWDDLKPWAVDPRRLPGYDSTSGLWVDYRWERVGIGRVKNV